MPGICFSCARFKPLHRHSIGVDLCDSCGRQVEQIVSALDQHLPLPDFFYKLPRHVGILCITASSVTPKKEMFR